MGGNFVGFRNAGGDVDKPAVSQFLKHVFCAHLDLLVGDVLMLPYTGTADQHLERMA